MGEEFSRRRRQATTGGGSAAGGDDTGASGSVNNANRRQKQPQYQLLTRRPSQQPQQQQQQQQQQRRGVTTTPRSSSNNNNNNNNNNNHSSTVVMEQGIIRTLLDKFGFITRVNRGGNNGGSGGDGDIFFHYSECCKHQGGGGRSGGSRSGGGGGSGGGGRISEEVYTWQIGDEVQFRIGLAPTTAATATTTFTLGQGQGERERQYRALDVQRLAPGTIQWMTYDEPHDKRYRGEVVNAAAPAPAFAAASSSSSSPIVTSTSTTANNNTPPMLTSSSDGTLRVIHDDGDDDDDDHNNSNCNRGGENGSSNGKDDNGNNARTTMPMEVRYRAVDYVVESKGVMTRSTTNNNNGNKNKNLERGDVVEFVMATCIRTGRKYARDIVLIESMDKKVIRTAKLERGVVVSNKGDFGFLRSTTRMEEIYFHISHMVTNDDDDDKNKDNTLMSLEEGQEMEFYVINDNNCGMRGRGKSGGGGCRCVARRIRPLSKGTVKFEHVIAEGVTGLVVECPIESSSSSSTSSNDPFGDRKRGDRGGSSSSSNTNNGDGRSRVRGLVMGKVRLIDEIHDEGNEMRVVEVSLPLEAYPCGTFAINRTGTEVGSWIRPGDILLFDVVRRTVDGAYLAVPTKYARKPPPPPGVDDIVNSDDRAIRLIEPSLCGRTEGVVKSIHDNYGFISLAERNVDAYFPFFEILPLEIQRDLARGAGEDVDGFVRTNRLGGRIHPEAGMEVSFDLSLQLLSATTGVGGRSYSNNNRQGKEERESLRARRICILPKGTVKDKILVASCVSARVSREDLKQPFVGMLELDEQLKVGCETQRHPLVTRLIDEISNGKYGQEEVTFHDILSEADRRVVIAMVEARDDLEWSYVGPNNNNDSSADTSHRKLRIARKKVDSIHDPISGTPAVEASTEGEIVDNPLEGQESRIEVVDEGNASSMEVANNASGSYQKNKVLKSIKSIRYDRSAFTDLSGGSLVAGDILTCDVVLLRRSGMVVVENINVIERVERSAVVVSAGDEGKENTSTKQRLGLIGFVSKYEPSRQFGFITVVDENGSKTGEHVFFHSKEIESGSADDVQDGDSQPTRSNKPPRGDVIIGKGDEVKFDVGPGKNGKMNATNILLLPRGTIQIQTDSTDTSMSCTGYVLIEPAYTSLVVNTAPSTIALQSSEQGAGRWANVRDDKTKTVTSMKEGMILLLSDPSRLFSPHLEVGSPEKQTTTDPEIKSSKYVAQDAKVESTKDSESHNSTQSVLGTHLEYKLSSLAVRGFMNGGGGTSSSRSDAPKRGDLVSFSRTRGARLLKDVRVEKMGAATSVTGTLIELDIDNDTAIFVSSENDVRYEINLIELVSCDKLLLKDKEQVNGILHEGKIYGVCRTKDVSLASSFGNSRDSSSSGISIGNKERPKLNLTVKKELQGMGGQIMAQSRMAKGPDGTNGFDSGWTRRVSLHMKEEDIPAAAMDNSLSASASEFVPTLSIAASGFEPIEADE